MPALITIDLYPPPNVWIFFFNFSHYIRIALICTFDNFWSSYGFHILFYFFPLTGPETCKIFCSFLVSCPRPWDLEFFFLILLSVHPGPGTWKKFRFSKIFLRILFHFFSLLFPGSKTCKNILKYFHAFHNWLFLNWKFILLYVKEKESRSLCKKPSAKKARPKWNDIKGCRPSNVPKSKLVAP